MTMLCSKEEEERRVAVLQIISIRGAQELGDTSPSLRILPYLNTQATTLKNLIDWEGAKEPVITRSLTKVELLGFIEKPMEVDYFPCHTQAMERAGRK